MGFAENVTAWREKKGWTLRDLVDALGHAAPSTVYRWETPGTSPPNGTALIQIAKALGCAVDDLLAGIDEGYDAARAARTAQAVPGLDAQERTLLAQLRAIATFRRQELDAYLHWFRYRLSTVTEDRGVLEAVDVDPEYQAWCEMFGKLTAEHRHSAFHMFQGHQPQTAASAPQKAQKRKR